MIVLIEIQKYLRQIERDYTVVAQRVRYFICSITPTNLDQLSKPRTVLESARPEDSKTVPES